MSPASSSYPAGAWAPAASSPPPRRPSACLTAGGFFAGPGDVGPDPCRHRRPNHRDEGPQMTIQDTSPKPGAPTSTPAPPPPPARRHHDDRRAEPGPLAGARGRGDDLRDPRRLHPPGVRPACSTPRSATSCAPRAGRRPRRAGVRRRHRPGRRLHGHQRPRRDQPGHPDRRRVQDSVPMVAITGQVGASQIGTDAFQEADIRGITMPITKHNYLVTDPADIPGTIAEAFYIASTGRPGPVLVDIAKSALTATTEFPLARAAAPARLPAGDQAARQAGARGRPDDRRGPQARAVRRRRHHPRPRLAELIALAERTGIPVVTTLMARGAIPDSHDQHLGMPGMHGSVAAVAALQKSDLIVSLGARFDDRVNRQPRHLRARRQGRARGHRPRRDRQEPRRRRADRRRRQAGAARAGRGALPLGYDMPDDGSLSPQYVIERLGANRRPRRDLHLRRRPAPDVAAQFISYEHPNTWINSGGLGTMGYGVPSAMGAKVGCPDTTVWAIDGDGCFQMTNQELATCTIEGIPVKIAVINNESLGMVRQWQTLFYDGRYSNTDLQSKRVPDFVKLAEAYGAVGLACDDPADVDAVIAKAMEINDVPVVIDFRVHRDAMVWPMVAAGASNDEIKYARDLAPEFEEDDL
ncbi:hypothetical protein LUZ63_021770 [Rhynchospora breviuscula]|uniref:Acetolactate synthase n=1 Tax=Rhynchospora breviuscula TaxID=2022672 RepID=A0A9P9Z626_9POAL|nr:hypothetical protein LUZ63_021770 [Rhynchospora breviuscula]